MSVLDSDRNSLRVQYVVRSIRVDNTETQAMDRSTATRTLISVNESFDMLTTAAAAVVDEDNSKYGLS